MVNFKFELKDAMYIKAEVSYSKIILINGQYEFYSRPMKHYSPRLFEIGWLKIHKSYIVNPKYIAQISEDRENVCLNNGMILPISRRKRTQILKWRKSNL